MLFRSSKIADASPVSPVPAPAPATAEPPSEHSAESPPTWEQLSEDDRIRLVSGFKDPKEPGVLERISGILNSKSSLPDLKATAFRTAARFRAPGFAQVAETCLRSTQSRWLLQRLSTLANVTLIGYFHILVLFWEVRMPGSKPWQFVFSTGMIPPRRSRDCGHF